MIQYEVKSCFYVRLNLSFHAELYLEAHGDLKKKKKDKGKKYIEKNFELKFIGWSIKKKKR